MDGHIDPWGGSPGANARVGDLSALPAAFAAALNAPDVRAARGLVTDALTAGASPGRLYVDVVRPALAALQSPDAGPARSARARLAAGVAEAILADLVAHLPGTASSGAGRAAILSCRTAGIEAVDGTVAMDFLETEGWHVERILGGVGVEPDDELGELPHASPVELAVAVIAGPEDALRLAPVCTRLRRLPDPPVFIVCDFSGAPVRAASHSLGADDVVGDPAELLRSAAARLPGHGARRWGVGLRRSGQTLVLAPTGTLDITSVGRLADVAVTRAGTFSRLVVDLREVAALDPSGVRELAGWPDALELGSTEYVTVADTGDVAGSDRLVALRQAARWQVVAQLTA